MQETSCCIVFHANMKGLLLMGCFLKNSLSVVCDSLCIFTDLHLRIWLTILSSSYLPWVCSVHAISSPFASVSVPDWNIPHTSQCHTRFGVWRFASFATLISLHPQHRLPSHALAFEHHYRAEGKASCALSLPIRSLVANPYAHYPPVAASNR